MKVLLDTTICVNLFRKKSEAIKSRLTAEAIGTFVISSITEAELRFGAEKSQHAEKNHRLIDTMTLTIPVVQFDSPAAIHYGAIRNELESKGIVIGPLDMLIAAHGRSLNLTVASTNHKEFKRVPNLKSEDWSIL